MTLARTTGNGDQFARAAFEWIGAWDPGAIRPEMTGLLEEALERLPDEDSATRSRIMSKLAMEGYFGYPPERVRQLHEEGLAMARRVDDPVALAFALGFYPNYNAMLGNDVWTAQTEEALALGQAANDARAIQTARMSLVYNLAERGDMERFDAEVAAAAELADTVRVPAYRWLVPMWQATRAMMRGELALAEELSLQALTLGSEASDPATIPMFGVQLFATRREQDRLGETEGGVRGMIAGAGVADRAGRRAGRHRPRRRGP
jgi:hypothetical protein